jgi:hypothetical protein
MLRAVVARRGASGTHADTPETMLDLGQSAINGTQDVLEGVEDIIILPHLNHETAQNQKLASFVRQTQRNATQREVHFRTTSRLLTRSAH